MPVGEVADMYFEALAYGFVLAIIVSSLITCCYEAGKMDASIQKSHYIDKC